MSEENRVIVAAEGTGEIMDAASYEVSQFAAEDGTAAFVRVTLHLGIINLNIDFSEERAEQFIQQFTTTLQSVDSGPEQNR